MPLHQGIDALAQSRLTAPDDLDGVVGRKLERGAGTYQGVPASSRL
jgi:hypothetical protein